MSPRFSLLTCARVPRCWCAHSVHWQTALMKMESAQSRVTRLSTSDGYTLGRAHVKIHQSTYKTKTDERQDRWRADVHLYLTVLLHKENEYNLSFLFCPALFVLSSDIWRNYKLKCPFFDLFGRHFWIFFFFLVFVCTTLCLTGKIINRRRA